MSIKERIIDGVKDLLEGDYDIRETDRVPRESDLGHRKKALLFPAVVFAADIRDSTQMHEDHQKQTVAKLHRAFLYTMTECIRARSGCVRSFDGDGLLAFWHDRGPGARQQAVGAALDADTIWRNDLAAMIGTYREVDFGIGIFEGRVLATKAGIQGARSDSALIWIGDAVNRAVKTAKRSKYPHAISLSSGVWGSLDPSDRYHNPNAWIFTSPIWQERTIAYLGHELTIHAWDSRK